MKAVRVSEFGAVEDAQLEDIPAGPGGEKSSSRPRPSGSISPISW